MKKLPFVEKVEFEETSSTASVKLPDMNIQTVKSVELENMDEKFKKKIQELRNATKDDGFLNDLREISEDFKDTDIEGWPEDEKNPKVTKEQIETFREAKRIFKEHPF